MTQDVLKGRRTEIEYLNGLVSDKGRELGIATPASDAVVQFVQGQAPGALKQEKDNLRVLAAKLGVVAEAEAQAARI